MKPRAYRCLLFAAMAALAADRAAAAEGRVGGAAVPAVLQESERQLATALEAVTGESDLRVSLDVDAVPLRDALKKLFEQAGREFSVDADVPAETRVTLKLKDVRLTTLLNAVTESAGIGWRRETRDGKPVYRFGKALARRVASVFYPIAPSFSLSTGTVADVFASRLFAEERHSFTCPHCKAEATVLRARRAPRCVQCSREFQSAWQFCPFDGEKRPAPAQEWKHCPVCGKALPAKR